MRASPEQAVTAVRCRKVSVAGRSELSTRLRRSKWPGITRRTPTSSTPEFCYVKVNIGNRMTHGAALLLIYSLARFALESHK